MPRGIYKRTEYHLKFSRENLKKAHILNLGRKRPEITGMNNPARIYCWKGDNVQYPGLHRWVRIHFGLRPPFCDLCGVAGKQNGSKWSIQWANKNHTHTRNRKDWLRLCVSCHRKLDRKS